MRRRQMRPLRHRLHLHLPGRPSVHLLGCPPHAGAHLRGATMTKDKLKIGIYELTGCAGDALLIVDCEEELRQYLSGGRHRVLPHGQERQYRRRAGRRPGGGLGFYGERDEGAPRHPEAGQGAGRHRHLRRPGRPAGGFPRPQRMGEEPEKGLRPGGNYQHQTPASPSPSMPTSRWTTTCPAARSARSNFSRPSPGSWPAIRPSYSASRSASSANGRRTTACSTRTSTASAR